MALGYYECFTWQSTDYTTRFYKFVLEHSSCTVPFQRTAIHHRFLIGPLFSRRESETEPVIQTGSTFHCNQTLLSVFTTQQSDFVALTSCNIPLKEHISIDELICLWGHGNYLLTAFSACFAPNVFQENQHCIPSMIRIFLYCLITPCSAVLFCGISMYQHDPSGVPYFLHLCAILPSTDHLSGDIILVLFFFSKLTDRNYYNFFLYIVYFPLPKTFQRKSVWHCCMISILF